MMMVLTIVEKLETMRDIGSQEIQLQSQARTKA